MEAKDLMVDIFVYFNCFDGTCITVKVTGFKDNIVYGVSENGSHWCTIEKVEPIPLTSEILEKNDFAYNKNNGAFVAYAEESYSNQTVEISLFHVKNEYNNIQLHICESRYPEEVMLHLMECNYIHELQHVFRACGIKKEIEL